MRVKHTVLLAALSCMTLLTACGNNAVKADVKTDADTGITDIPDMDTIRENLENKGYISAPFENTSSGGNEIISMYRGEEPPDFSCIMILRADSAEALLADAEAIDKIEATKSQYSDARSYKYLDDEKLGSLYIFCTEDALADAGITAAE